MKRIGAIPPLFILILSTIVLTTATPAAIAPEHGPSASGFGTFRMFNSAGTHTELWSFAFEAAANKNGQARGRAQFDNLTAQMQVIVRINCLRVDSGAAVISGIVLHSDDPDLPKSAIVVFAARDGQLLPTPGIDTISPPFQSFGDCNEGEPLTILPLESGEIEIQP